MIEAPSASLPNAPIQTYVIPTYPEPYFRAAGGGVYMRSSGPDGEPEDQSISQCISPVFLLSIVLFIFHSHANVSIVDDPMQLQS